MGGCLSKKSTNASSPNALLNPPEEVKSDTQVEKKNAEEETVKKEIFIIKHRKSHEIERRFEDEESKAKNGLAGVHLQGRLQFWVSLDRLKMGQRTDDKNVVNGDDDGMVGERESCHRRQCSQATEAGSSSQGRGGDERRVEKGTKRSRSHSRAIEKEMTVAVVEEGSVVEGGAEATIRQWRKPQSCTI
ncbi:unnamed protein product [Fraxinus pennsylvanica]|uniref:Uncharacterized protein n=1 Tax=Fraxinus pennsylvanica TaxID=56036 RepID=A0AAD2DUT6_9LAMI|nr:unnamed protein product [Fraxinus pennsylvanica]